MSDAVAERPSPRSPLDFIWHLRGSVPLDWVATNQEALDRVELFLEQERRSVIRQPTFVTFDDPLWGLMLDFDWREHFGLKRRALHIYDHGHFWIEEGLGGRRLRYDLRCLHGLVFCLLGTAIFSGLFSLDKGFPRGLMVSALLFGLLYGINVLRALLRVPYKIQEAIRRA